jgi:hypothetical protein
LVIPLCFFFVVHNSYISDKYKKEIASIEAELKEKKEDTVLLNKLEENKIKLTKATENYNLISPYLSNFNQLGAEAIAKTAKESGWLDNIALSKIKDAARNADDFLVLEAKAPDNIEIKKQYDIAKDKTEGYKAPLKLYLAKSISADSAIVLMNTIYPIQAKNLDKVKIQLSSDFIYVTVGNASNKNNFYLFIYKR